MNKKEKTAFVCNECGQDFTKWYGRCPACSAWESITEFRMGAGGSGKNSHRSSTKNEVVTLAEVPENKIPARIKSRSPEFDRIMGGGAVPGALVLIGGDPGIGKSTLLLQLASAWAASGLTCLYVSGEESCEQISMRAQRLRVGGSPLLVMAETSVEAIIEACSQKKPQIVVIDSIQTVFSEEMESAPGSVAQVREAAAALLRFGKANRVTIFMIGHVTKDGQLAGPRLLEHMVDTVLYFEGDPTYQYRLLRAVKNRYGPSGEIALFSMADTGLHEVTNASHFFLLNHETPQAGSAVTAVMEGTRPLAVELQALVNRTHFGLPQRVASGVNPKKMALLLAVIERYGGVQLGDYDIFLNVTGGLSVSEPAADLAMAAAIISSFRNIPVRKGIALIGETGLGGEVRPVNNLAARLKELKRLGFTDIIIPRPPRAESAALDARGLSLLPCDRIEKLADILF
ncbi:MAG: DNA repair protein RadA [Chitinivibrionales bacterium]|nr:DNA repair protein RadA [Chitinivibrionales bacterium]